MSKPSNINRIHRFLDEFFVVDYACYGADQLPEGKLDLYLDRCDKKVLVYQGDIVYGCLKLNEMEQRYIFAILSSGMNLLECGRIPSDDKTPIDQKFKVGLWLKCIPFGCIPPNTCIEEKAKKKGDGSEISFKIYRNIVEDSSGKRIKKEEFSEYELMNERHTLSLRLDDLDFIKVECDCCSIQKIQDFIGLFEECDVETHNNCC